LRADRATAGANLRVELLKGEGWVRLKPAGSSTYVKAGPTASAVLTLEGTGREDECRWRLQHRIDVVRGPVYEVFESKRFPGKYIRVKSAADPVLDCNGDGFTDSRFTTTYAQRKVALPAANAGRQLRNKAAGQIAGIVSGVVRGGWRSTSDGFLYGFEDLGDGVVLLRNKGTGNCLKTASNGGSVTATGTGCADDSKWIFTPSVGFAQLESKLYPGQFLRLPAANAALDATGSRSDEKTQFTFVAQPLTDPAPPSPAPDAQEADLWKALLFGDMLFEMFEQSNVSSVLTWVTHPPDDKYGGRGRVGYVLTNDDANSLTVVGTLIKTINSHVKRQLLDITRAHGKVRALASFEPASGEMTVFLINKNNVSEDVTLTLSNFLPATTGERYVFGNSSGVNPEDPAPTFAAKGTVGISGNVVTTTLDAVSLTVLHLHDPATRIASVGGPVILTNTVAF
jgi:hypothetical protein